MLILEYCVLLGPFVVRKGENESGPKPTRLAKIHNAHPRDHQICLPLCAGCGLLHDRFYLVTQWRLLHMAVKTRRVT